MNDIAELADELRDGSRRGTDTCVQAADMLERMREALDLIANTGMDARQCMLTARNALKSI